jgi:DNA primase large subunit
MEEFEVSYSLDNEQQFWDGECAPSCSSQTYARSVLSRNRNTTNRPVPIELEEIVSVQCTSSGLIDNALRTFLHFTTNFKDEYLPSDYELGCCLSRLLDSEIFQANKDYVRIQLVYSLLQEDEPATLYVIASLLLMDGQRNEVVFEMMNREGAFTRLVELIKLGKDEDSSLHRLLMELLYQMSRMQRLSSEELSGVDDEFVRGLFQIIEQLSDDVDDPYHYPVIRVLVSCGN